MATDPLSGNEQYAKASIKDISRGSYGFVILARDKENGEEVALKFIERGQKISIKVEREIINHLKLDHPHIVGLRGVFRTDHHLVLELDYAAGGSLRQEMARKGCLGEPEARRLFQQLMLAVDYAHRMGVANRDIKPENTLLDGSSPPNVKLADFGYSKDEESQSMANTKLGTPAYTAPEIFKLRPGESYDPKKADIWSCGVMLFEMVAGLLPFEREDDGKVRNTVKTQLIMNRLMAGDYAFPASVPISDACKHLLSTMLVIDVDRRISIKEIFKHPWFMENLAPGAARINLMLVQESKSSPPSEEDIQRIRGIVDEAQTVARNVGLSAVYLQPSCDQATMFSNEFQ